ncbi:hypothetical protein MMB87_001774 [Listeria monocytogenes]|nr:MFS transporter [Listeria monocytogenes]EIQ2676012.1 hypothetical protein [Listeria monocytogenes]EIQ2680679.1 hypothetical protein [Listeria monocytogenes]EIQ2688448.1 hypothetical protein [Listeria monocytogenes]EIQ2691521.1 hypothetical protein [Listeria monocytogenes]EIQ2749759.1 hypothetical protein [Listeria monocytogenes]
MKNKYLSTSLGLYMNYFVHGMALIIIAHYVFYLYELTEKEGIFNKKSS